MTTTTVKLESMVVGKVFFFLVSAICIIIKSQCGICVGCVVGVSVMSVKVLPNVTRTKYC